MKYILAPLMAIATFAGMATAAAPDNAATIDYAKYNLIGPVADVYAYWPDHMDSDPETRVVELLLPSGYTYPYRLHYRDPKDNRFDLSVAEDADDALASIEEEGMGSFGDLTAEEYEAKSLEDKIAFSVYLDKDDKIMYLAQGSSIPTSNRDVLGQTEAYVRHLNRKLDPNTPGIEDLKDPGSIVAQLLLNQLALQGPDALEEAKNNPDIVRLLDALYDSADDFFKQKQDLEAKVVKEEAGKMEKRHNKPHHHHKKSSHKKAN
ncbi:MAG: hypothetical protein J3R72DRAFT_228694 [Linnemannia gamsii]|nr:MAG: hypothetical protein J3R72DRAFT_228694 [Linnemannia gamsii]